MTPEEQAEERVRAFLEHWPGPNNDDEVYRLYTHGEEHSLRKSDIVAALDGRATMRLVNEATDLLDRLIAASDADLSCTGCGIYRRGALSASLDHGERCPVQQARAFVRERYRR